MLQSYFVQPAVILAIATLWYVKYKQMPLLILQWNVWLQYYIVSAAYFSECGTL